MAHPYHHALSSVRKWGGEVEDYLPVHNWFDVIRTIKLFLFSRSGFVVVVLTCHWSFIQLRPEPVADLRPLARVEQSPGTRNSHRVQRDGRLRWSGAERSLQGSGSRGPSGALRCCSR